MEEELLFDSERTNNCEKFDKKKDQEIMSRSTVWPSVNTKGKIGWQQKSPNSSHSQSWGDLYACKKAFPLFVPQHASFVEIGVHKTAPN